MYTNIQDIQDTHLSQKILIDEFKCLHAQSGILNNLMKNPPNLRNYRQLETLMDVVQRFLPV